MKKKAIIKIVQDSREQTPLDFAGLHCEVTVGTVPVYDYALFGDEKNFAIERKSINDFVQSFTTTNGLRLEKNKLKKAREAFGYLPIIYIVEGRLMDILPVRDCICAKVNPAERPSKRCEFCHDSRFIGYNYDRRLRVTPQFTYHQLWVLLFEWQVEVLFTDNRTASACAIEGILRRRYEEISKEMPEDDDT